MILHEGEGVNFADPPPQNPATHDPGLPQYPVLVILIQVSKIYSLIKTSCIFTMNPGEFMGPRTLETESRWHSWDPVP